MKFVVRPERGRGPKPCIQMITQCALCQEDPRFCPGPDPIEM